MNKARPLRILSAVFIVAAAVAAGYGLNAKRTEAVVIANKKIPAWTLILPQDVTNDFTTKNEAVNDVEPGALVSLQGIAGHTTQMVIMPNAQVQVPMLNNDNSLQALVNADTPAGNVSFPVPYKLGSVQQYIPPDSYVNLAAQGQNGMNIHADHVLVLQNTDYSPDINASESQNQNQQNQNPFLVLTLPESTYLSMFQSISTGNVQVLLIPQNQSFIAPVGSFAASQSAAQSTGQMQTTQSSSPKISKSSSKPISISKDKDLTKGGAVIGGK